VSERGLHEQETLNMLVDSETECNVLETTTRTFPLAFVNDSLVNILPDLPGALERITLGYRPLEDKVNW